MSITPVKSTSFFADFSSPDFPKDLLILILSKLPRQDRIRVALVSKTWRDLSRDKQVWREDLLLYFPPGHAAFSSPLSSKELFYRYHTNVDFYRNPIIRDNTTQTAPQITVLKKASTLHAAGNTVVSYNAKKWEITTYDVFSLKEEETLVIKPLIQLDDDQIFGQEVTQLYVDGDRLYCSFRVNAQPKLGRIEIYQLPNLTRFKSLSLPKPGEIRRICAKDSMLFAAYSESSVSHHIAVWDLSTAQIIAQFQYQEKYRGKVFSLQYDEGFLLIEGGEWLTIADVKNASLVCTITWQNKEGNFPVYNQFMPLLRRKKIELFSPNYAQSIPYFQIDIVEMKKHLTGKLIQLKFDVEKRGEVTFSSEVPTEQQTYNLYSKEHFFRFLNCPKSTPGELRFSPTFIQDAISKAGGFITIDAVVAGSKLFFLNQGNLHSSEKGEDTKK